MRGLGGRWALGVSYYSAVVQYSTLTVFVFVSVLGIGIGLDWIGPD